MPEDIVRMTLLDSNNLCFSIRAFFLLPFFHPFLRPSRMASFSFAVAMSCVFIGIHRVWTDLTSGLPDTITRVMRLSFD